MAITVVGTPSRAFSASANNIVLTIPSGLAANDYLVFAGTHQNQPPSDWTLPSAAGQVFTRTGNAFAVNDASYRGDILAYHKVASTGSEPASYTFTFPATGRIAGALYILRGVDGTNPVDGVPAGQGAVTGTTTRTILSFTAGHDNAYLFALFNNQLVSPNALAGSLSVDQSVTQLDLFTSNGTTDNSTITRSVLGVYGKTLGTAGATPVLTATVTAATGSSGMAVAFRAAVTNAAPVASFTHTEIDLESTFTDTSTDSDGTIATRAWDFGDGSTSSATNPVHVFDQPGTYTVSLTATDNSGASNTATQSVTVYGVSAWEWEVTRASWVSLHPNIVPAGGGITQLLQDISFVPGSGPGLTEQLTWFAQGKKMFVAHRGLSGNYPEETLYAYWAACLLGYNALEISVQKSSSGTFWAFHDSTTDRTTGVAGTIASMTDAQLSVLTNTAAATDVPSQPRQPVAKLSDILAVYGGKRLIFIEDKTYANTSAVLDILDANGGTNWYVWKQQGTGTPFLGIGGRGYKTWGYFFDADMAASFSTKQGAWDFIGLDYLSSDATLDPAIATATPARVIAHIIPTATQRDRLLGKGVRGLMVSDSHMVTPVAN